jgi:hypothetical protein
MPVSRPPTILVTGPALSGVTGVSRGLRDRLGSGYRVVERLGPGQRPAAVVFVVSAAAPMTDSDVKFLEGAVEFLEAAVDPAAVVAVVSKIDVHRTWPRVLEANRRCCPQVAWEPVAAAPQIGPSKLDRLVGAVHTVLARAGSAGVRPARAGPSRAGPSAPKSRASRALVLRSLIQQSRVRLAGQARAECAALRAELRREAAGVNRGGGPEFCSAARRRAVRTAAELDTTLTAVLTRLAGGAGLPASTVSAGPSAALESYLPRFSRPELESRLSVLLSAGFGLGVSLTVGRSLADLAPAWAPVILACCLATGVVLTGWMVRTRTLLSERAALDRWVTELTAALRTAMDDRLLTQMLAAESALVVAATTAPVRGFAGLGEPPRGDRQ